MRLLAFSLFIFIWFDANIQSRFVIAYRIACFIDCLIMPPHDAQNSARCFQFVMSSFWSPVSIRWLSKTISVTTNIDYRADEEGVATFSEEPHYRQWLPCYFSASDDISAFMRAAPPLLLYFELSKRPEAVNRPGAHYIFTASRFDYKFNAESSYFLSILMISAFHAIAKFGQMAFLHLL